VFLPFPDVCSWHLADIDADDEQVCFWGKAALVSVNDRRTNDSGDGMGHCGTRDHVRPRRLDDRSLLVALGWMEGVYSKELKASSTPQQK
jgi:hypothetical protein